MLWRQGNTSHGKHAASGCDRAEHDGPGRASPDGSSVAVRDAPGHPPAHGTRAGRGACRSPAARCAAPWPGSRRRGKVVRVIGSGTYVADASAPGDPEVPVLEREDYSPREIMDARMLLEPRFASLIVIHANKADIEAIRKSLLEAERATDFVTFEHWDGQFHQMLAEATHNRLIIDLFRIVTQSRDTAAWGDLKKGQHHRRTSRNLLSGTRPHLRGAPSAQRPSGREGDRGASRDGPAEPSRSLIPDDRACRGVLRRSGPVHLIHRRRLRDGRGHDPHGWAPAHPAGGERDGPARDHATRLERLARGVVAGPCPMAHRPALRGRPARVCGPVLSRQLRSRSEAGLRLSRSGPVHSVSRPRPACAACHGARRRRKLRLHLHVHAIRFGRVGADAGSLISSTPTSGEDRSSRPRHAVRS